MKAKNIISKIKRDKKTIITLHFAKRAFYYIQLSMALAIIVRSSIIIAFSTLGILTFHSMTINILFSSVSIYWARDAWKHIDEHCKDRN